MAKILVIDDDAMVRTTIEQTLEDAGYEVVTAIAISGGGRIGNADFLKNALALGAMDVVPKPFDPDALLTIVANCLAGRSHPR
jgi:DNA-binding NtrC family response regulator